MKNKILYIIGVLVIIAVVFLAKYALSRPISDRLDNDGKSETPDLEAPDLDIGLPLSNDPKDVAWNLFQKYLNYNKNKNKEGVKSVVYKIAAVCTDPKTTIDCEGRMNSAWEYGSQLKKEDFVNVWQDEKQIILSTDFWIEDSDDMDLLGRFRSIIYFIRDVEGNLKLLSFSPSKGGATTKAGVGMEELNARIIRYTEDNDSDGMTDYSEECLDAQDRALCIETNPKIRDTDADGYWDGVDALLK